MLTQDLRYAARLLRRNPGFSTSAILTLTLGIGMTTAIFSVVDAALFRPIPMPDPDRLMMVWETDRDTGTSHEPGSWPDFLDFQQRSRRIDRFAAIVAGEATLTPDAGEPTRLAQLSVTHELLPLVGVTPLAGRVFTEEEDRVGGPRVILISERLWERVFQRDHAVIGRTLRIDDLPQTVIGVVPSGADFGILQILSAADYSRGFADRDPRSQVDVFAPLQADAKQLVRDTHPLLFLSRLAPGVAAALAQEELAAIAADLERAYPENKARGVFVEPIRNVIFGRTRPALLVLLAAVGLVLLIACVDVANLLLARGTARRREVAVRTALGAGAPHLARQFIVENVLLTSIAAALGIVVAFVGLRLLLALAPPDVPRLASVAIDARVLSVAIVVSVFVGLAFGALPVLQSRRTDLQAALNAEDTRGATSGRDGTLIRTALVVAEIAFAVVLLVGAGLLIKSVWRLQQVDPGFDASGVLKTEFELPAGRYPFSFQDWPDIQSIHRFNALLLARAAALPGVESVAIAGSHPLSAGFTNSFVIVGREAESRDFPEISMRGVTPGYFRTVRLRLVRGRLLQDSDVTRGPAVVVINEAAADRLFAGRDPVGQQLAFWGVTWTIVGVVGDEKFHGIAAASPIAAYTSLAQAPARGGQSLLVRTTGDPSALAGAVRGAIAEIDPALAVFGVEPLAETLSASIGTDRFLRLLLGIFAAMALLLAAIGIHGVLSYTVAQRTREIGIRMALGASSRGVMRLVLAQGLLLTLIGLGVGVVMAAFFARSLAGLLFGVQPMDPAAFAAALAVLGIVATIAIWVPARRAVGVDPILAIRQS
jgi:putative ABC transport system permease protein